VEVIKKALPTNSSRWNIEICGADASVEFFLASDLTPARYTGSKATAGSVIKRARKIFLFKSLGSLFPKLDSKY
jgi:hypothetical protein